MADAPLPDTLVEIRTTFADREAAQACADRIVAARLAACVHIDGPIHSVYRWHDAVQTAEEWRCSFKTTRAGAVACVDAIVAGHPYELPEVLVTAVATTPAYAAWVGENVVAS